MNDLNEAISKNCAISVDWTKRSHLRDLNIRVLSFGSEPLFGANFKRHDIFFVGAENRLFHQ